MCFVSYLCHPYGKGINAFVKEKVLKVDLITKALKKLIIFCLWLAYIINHLLGYFSFVMMLPSIHVPAIITITNPSNCLVNNHNNTTFTQ